MYWEKNVQRITFVWLNSSAVCVILINIKSKIWKVLLAFFQFVRTKNTEINNSHRKKVKGKLYKTGFIIYIWGMDLFIFWGKNYICTVGWIKRCSYFCSNTFFDTAPRLTPRFEAVSSIKFIKLFSGVDKRKTIFYTVPTLLIQYPDFTIVYIVYGIESNYWSCALCWNVHVGLYYDVNVSTQDLAV